MNVSGLQQHLADLARLLEASGAKPIAADLTSISEGLAPFKDAPLKEFADFLGRAVAFTRGETPDVPLSKPKGGGKTPAKKAPAVDHDALARELHGLYERAASPDVTTDQIAGLIARLAPLSVPKLTTLGQQIGITAKKKTKQDLIDAIQQRILTRKGSALRSAMI